MSSICVNILFSVILGFVTPLIFSGASAVMTFIFDTFTRPFQFTYEQGQGTNWFVEMLGSDLLNIVVKIMISAGVVLAIFMLAVNIFKLFFAGFSKRVESPIALCIRAVMSIFLSYWIIDIVYKVVFPMFQWMLDKVNNITINSGKTVSQSISDMYSLVEQTSASDFGLSEGTNFVDKLAGAISGTSYGSVGTIITAIVFIVFFIKSIIALFRLIAEMAERYLLVNVLTVCSPMIMPTVISDSTMQIFLSWIRMMIANCLVLIFNSLGMIMLNVAFVNVGSACTAIVGMSGSGRWMRPITAMVVFVALIKVVEKFDVYLAQLAFKIQAIGGNDTGPTLGGLIALGGKANKNAAQVAQAGGLGNYLGEKAGNVLGFFGGNRSGLAKSLSQNATEYRAASKEEARQLGHGALADRQNEDEINEENKQLRNQKNTQETDGNNPDETKRVPTPDTGGDLGQEPDTGTGGNDGDNTGDGKPKDTGGNDGGNLGGGNPKDTGTGGDLGQEPDTGTGGNDGDNTGDGKPKDTGGNDGGNLGGGNPKDTGTGGGEDKGETGNNSPEAPKNVFTTGGNNDFVPVSEPSGTFDLDRPGESGTHGQEVVSNDVEPSQNTTQDTTTTVETVERNIRERAKGVNVEKTLDDSYKDNSLSDADVTRRQEEYKRKFYEQKSQEEEKYAKDNPEYPEDK